MKFWKPITAVLVCALALGSATSVAEAAHARVGRMHEFHSVRLGHALVFRLSGLRGCEPVTGRIRAGSRDTALRVATVKRAVRQRRLRVSERARRATLQIGCAREAMASAAAAPGDAITAAPDGPSAPSGGWSVAYGDAFKEPICGTAGAGDDSCDNTLYPNGIAGEAGDIEGSNPDEMEEYNPSQVSVTSSGLNLNCSPASNLSTPSGYVAPRYLCGSVDSVGSSPAGYRFFNWKPGQGQEWAVQITAEFPPNTGEADPGWWSIDPSWTEELDFFEGDGDSAGRGGTWTKPGPGANPGGTGMTDPTWIYNTGSDSAVSTYNNFAGDLGFNPASGFHTYTTVLYPNNTFAEYVDGRNVAWDYVSPGGAEYRSGGKLAGPPTNLSNATMGLLMSYGLRDDTDGDPDPYFSSGNRDFKIRSVAVYEDAAAGGANSWNDGLAPGTRMSAS
jgi:hypothetical protein